MELLAERLRVARQAKGDTQQDVADYLGVRVGIVSLWERGKATPTKPNREKLAEYLGVTLDALEEATKPLYEVIEGLTDEIRRLAAQSAAQSKAREAQVDQVVRGQAQVVEAVEVALQALPSVPAMPRKRQEPRSR